MSSDSTSSAIISHSVRSPLRSSPWSYLLPIQSMADRSSFVSRRLYMSFVPVGGLWWRGTTPPLSFCGSRLVVRQSVLVGCGVWFW